MPLRTKESSDSVRRSRSPAHAAFLPLAHARVGARCARSRHRRRPGSPRRRARRSARRCPRLRGPYGAARVHDGRHPLAGLRPGLVPNGVAARRVRPLAAGAAGGGGPAGRRQRRGRRPGRLAPRQPLVDGVGPLHPVPRGGRGVPSAHVLRRQPGDRGRQGDGRDDTAGHLGDGTRSRPGAAADHHPAQRLERGRDDRPRRSVDRPAAALLDGAPHRGLQQLFGGGIGG